MRRSPLAVLILLAAVVTVLFLLTRPSGWLAAGEETGASPPLPEDSTARVDPPAPALDAVAPGPVAGPGSELDRQAVDLVLVKGRISFRVIDFAGHPVSGAQILLVRDETLLDEATTDEGGEVEFSADQEPARLILAAPHRPLEERDVVLRTGRQEILLSEGGRLSGRFVQEDGTSPGKVSFGIESNTNPTSIRELPAAVVEALEVRRLWKTHAFEETDEQGGFELTGLPETWSGRIWLRGGWKVVSTSHGFEGPSARGVRFTESTSALVVVIALNPTLSGRLVSQGDRSPIPGVKLSAMLRSPDLETPSFSITSSDENGHFDFERQQERISSLDLHLGASFHESPSILALDGANIPADGDLGEVIVDEVRHVPFRLQDPEGTPIAGGVALAAGLSSEPTGQDGRGQLRWLARSVERMFVEAPGFVPGEVELPPVIAEPLPVTLEHANQLGVTLRLPEGADATQFKVVVWREDRVTAVPFTEQRRQRPHATPWDYMSPSAFRRAAVDTFLSARLDGSTGRASFQALRPGVELELQVRGITGDMIYHTDTLAPLGPSERREIEVPLEDGMIVFRGRVLDQDGNPLPRAHLQLANQILGWTDDEGRFLCFLAAPETGTLLVQHSACSTKYLHDYAVPSHGKPVEFRLSPARQVTIEVVDESGAPVPQPEVWRVYGGFTGNTHRIEGNRHVCTSVPEETFEVMVRLGGRVYRQEHDPSVPEARIVVPVHGSLTVSVSEDTTANRSGRFLLQLTPPEGDPGEPLMESREAAANLRIELSAVLPGTYQATLRYLPSDEEEAAGRERESSAPVPVKIEASREAELRLALP